MIKRSQFSALFVVKFVENAHVSKYTLRFSTNLTPRLRNNSECLMFYGLLSK